MLALLGGVGLFLYGASQFYAAGAVKADTNFTVERGSSVLTTARRLEEQGLTPPDRLVPSEWLFWAGTRALKKEGELKAGVTPPKRVLEIAASMQSIMSEQTAELVRLGMLSPEAAGRWDGKYLPRFYESKLKDEASAWAKAVKQVIGRKRVMQGIGEIMADLGEFDGIEYPWPVFDCDIG